MLDTLARFTPCHTQSMSGHPVLDKAAGHDANGEHDVALQLLHEAANQGNPAAMAVLGKRLFFADRAPQSLKDGARLLQLSAREGNGEALCQVACFHALGLFPQSWEKAINLLARSAEAGWLPAQGQLLVLGQEPELRQEVYAGTTDDSVWQRLAGSIDLAWWQQPVPPRALSRSPDICTYSGFIPQITGQWLMALAQPSLQRARVYDAGSRQETVNETRTNRSMTFTMQQCDVASLLVQARIGATINKPVRQMEAIMVLHYAQGEEIKPHFDFVDTDSADAHQQLGQYGQRWMTFITYLNDGYEGGETGFPELELSNRGQAGDAIAFINVDDNSQPDRRTLHTGSPPTRGEKWIMTQFVREKDVVNIGI